MSNRMYFGNDVCMKRLQERFLNLLDVAILHASEFVIAIFDEVSSLAIKPCNQLYRHVAPSIKNQIDTASFY
jgi:hypothetical protein